MMRMNEALHDTVIYSVTLPLFNGSDVKVSMYDDV
jgi:hypothetical protein